MKYTIIATSIILALGSTSAIATNNSNGPRAESNASANATGGNANATGGSATLGSFNKFGGEGGNANVIGSGNSSNHNANVNTNANTNVNTLGQQQGQGQAQGQKQGQAQGQLQGQGQGQSQTATGGNAKQGQSQNASNNGVSNTTTVTGDTYEEKRQAPGIGIGYAPSSSPCRIAGGGGLSIPGGAITFGGSVEDEECQWRENARMFGALGDKATAVEALCQIERNKVLKTCKALAPAKAAETAPARTTSAATVNNAFTSYNP
jgi:hypothetical protein